MLLNNKWVINEIKEEIKKYLETSENELTRTKNLWDIAKAVLREKFIASQGYLKKIEKSQINNLTLHLKELEKQQQTKPTVNRKKKIIKIREVISVMDTKKTSLNIHESRNWFLEKINKIDGPLANSSRKKERTQ